MMIRLLTVLIILLCFFSSVSSEMIRVTVSLANVRAQPGSHHKIIASIKKGDLVPVIDSGKGWYKIRLQSGKEGWVYKKAVHLEKEDYHTRIEAMTQEVLGEYLKWANVNEVYIEEYRTARLDVMVAPKWSRLDTEQQKNLMIHLAREFTRLCEEDDLLKLQDKEAPYVAFFDRFNTLLGKANEVNTVFADE